ncbi:hypothetical protein [Rummeliibacillus pycnus]|uniref:hypothetical protein n=1 Tax=Rummeliibacillus pycnus TaxID=101070 RepID=UPI003D2C1CEE
MDKRRVGNILGFTSLVPVIISIIAFYALRGPNFDVYLGITIFSVLSIIGISLAIISWVMSKRHIPFIIGLLGNAFILICAFLLQLAMGIGEQ